MNCKRPDRDVPGLICGYPLPCPYHTAIIDTTVDPPTVTIPIVADQPALTPVGRKRLKRIALALKDAIEEEPKE